MKLSELLDHVLCILPFEEEVCRLNGIAATYVGHPLLEDEHTLNLKPETTARDYMIQQNRDVFREEHGISPGARVITLLPGSRLQEVTRMLPIFLQTAQLLRRSFADLVFVITVAANRDVESYIKQNMESFPLSAILVSGASIDRKYAAFNVSTAALCTSGSAVLELQLSRLPCVVAYRAHFLTEWLILWKTKLKFISLPNILLNSAVLPEILFQACTPANLAKGVSKVILDDNIRDQQILAAKEVLQLLQPHQYKMGTLEEFGASTDMSSPSMIAASTILLLDKQH